MDDAEQFHEYWPVGTSERQAFEVLHWTAARCSDGVHIGQQKVTDGVPLFEQQETGNLAAMPVQDVEPGLQPDLAMFRPYAGTGMLHINKSNGAARSVKAMSQMIARAARDARLTDRTAHGLHKARSERLAELGWTAIRTRAWTGHLTLQEVGEYTKGANMIQLLRGTEQKQNVDNGSGNLRKLPSQAPEKKY